MRHLDSVRLSALILALCLISFSCATDPKDPGPSDQEGWQVVIVGAGAGGLAAGATLARAGVKTLILEQHDKPGGYMTAFERGDYRFEVSLHMIDGLDPGGWTRALFEELGILDRVQPIRFDPLYRSVHPDFTIDVPADLDAYLTLLKNKFPHEADGITELFTAVMRIGDDVDGLSRIMSQSPLVRILQVPLVPFRHWDFVKNRNTTLDDFVARYISDPKAISVILQLSTFSGVPPSRSPAVLSAVMLASYHRRGVYHFLGGSQAVSNALADVIRENGGEVRLNTRVEKILIRKGRAVGVRTKGGEEIYAAYLVSNADGYQTYMKLVGKEHLKRKFVEYVKKLEPGVSVTEVFLGLDLDLAKVGLGDVAEIFYCPTYDIEDMCKSVHTMDIEKMNLLIAFFSNTDPTCAPPGKSVVVLCTGGAYDWEDRWRIDQGLDAYHELKEEVADRLVKVAETMVPGLRESIDEMEIGTPLTMERYTSNYRGSIIGWAPTPEQSMMKRMKQEGPIDNLLLAGAWTFPGGGQSACLMSGNAAAENILKRMK